MTPLDSSLHDEYISGRSLTHPAPRQATSSRTHLVRLEQLPVPGLELLDGLLKAADLLCIGTLHRPTHMQYIVIVLAGDYTPLDYHLG